MNQKLLLTLTAVASFTAGAAIEHLIFTKKNKMGVLRIDTSDPETDSYSFEITGGLDQLPKKKQIVLKVEVGPIIERDKISSYSEKEE